MNMEAAASWVRNTSLKEVPHGFITLWVLSLKYTCTSELPTPTSI